jgi:hypothetical protein
MIDLIFYSLGYLWIGSVIWINFLLSEISDVMLHKYLSLFTITMPLPLSGLVTIMFLLEAKHLRRVRSLLVTIAEYIL